MNCESIQKKKDNIPLDYIPLSSSKKINEKSRKNYVIFGDPKLYPRLQKILTNEKVDNVDSIIEYLKNAYPEYRRKKNFLLKKSVQKCIEIISDNFSFDNSDDDDLDIEMASKSNMENYVNDSLNQLYNNDESGEKRKINSNDSKDGKRSKMKNISIDKIDKDIESNLLKQTNFAQKYLIQPKVSFEDFGGLNEVIIDIKRLVFHLKNSELFRKLGVEPPKGFLLHGPPGVGKSLLVEALANDLQITYLRCGATEIMAGVSGESEEKIRRIFSLAKEMRPCLLFIDEIDAITSKRENASKELEKRIVTQLMICIDELSANDGSADGVMIIGATNRPDSLDPALRRAGRFDREIVIGIPDEKARLDILKVLLRNIKLEQNFDYNFLAHITPGYVGADLKSLIRESAILSLERFLLKNNIDHENLLQTTIQNFENITNDVFHIKMQDFEKALRKIQPSSKREGFATVPDVTWNDIGALSSIRQELQMSILAPVKFSDDVEKLGLSLSVGILLCGPPGCGKTLLAKAIANESGINFISVKGPELLNMYVGESERAVRAVFNRARCSKPCVIFFDEIDALCPKRTDSEASNVTSRVVNQLLTEMDGLESRDCFLLAATNRPDILDPAILRPGRFDKILYVGFPSAEDRYEIMLTITKKGTKPPISQEVDLKQLANDKRLDGFTGADLSSLVREASMIALREKINGLHNTEIILNNSHFNSALNKLKPSVSKKDREHYILMERSKKTI